MCPGSLSVVVRRAPDSAKPFDPLVTTQDAEVPKPGAKHLLADLHLIGEDSGVDLDGAVPVPERVVFRSIEMTMLFQDKVGTIDAWTLDNRDHVCPHAHFP